ncbi:ATP-dependent helicase [uncultured Helicobacter sp.]|uniref:ATP-dependent helicase n=1 Tax=uncultured Helicobacter sp. TaxID=175537 RepID=UPI002608221E|nr:ATP-dependent helicase [uncultured Helicobacter sp.]
MPLHNLNQEQYAAATAPMGHNLIIASAGTGKTSTIVGRIAHLLESGIEAHEILLLTFTNKASQEMIARVAKRFGDVAKKIECGTFHAVCYRFLKDKYAISLKQPKELKILFKSIAKSRVYQNLTSTPPYSGEYLFDLYSLFLNSRNSESFEEWLGARGSSDHSPYIDVYEGIFEEYRALKQSHNYMDYNDLLIEYANEMRQTPCPYKEILCDEYQDTNPLQNSVIHALNPKSLFCVGDYDQSIYAFNGADISIISSFQQAYKDSAVFTLRKNYRSTRYILDLANRVIEKNERIYPKELEVVNTDTPITPKLLVYNTLFEQYQGVAQKILTANHPLDDIAIIFRNNSSADGCEALLRELNIPTKRKGGVSFFDAKEVALMLDLCSLLYNPKDMMAYIHVLSYGAGIGDSIARELYQGLLRLGGGNAKRGLLMPDSSVRAFEKRAKNAQQGLFDDFFILQDVKRFDTIAQGRFVGHPILAHPKLSADSVRFLNEFYAIFERYETHNKPRELINKLAKSPLYEHIVEILCVKRARNKDGSLDLDRKTQAKEAIQRKLLLLQDIAKQYENLGRFLNAMVLSSNENTQGSGVNLLTIHASKGLEFGIVFIIDLMQGRFPNLKLIAKGGSVEEERRLFYVAITRAKTQLYLSYAKRDEIKNIAYEPSIFLHEAGLIKNT